MYSEFLRKFYGAIALKPRSYRSLMTSYFQVVSYAFSRLKKLSSDADFSMETSRMKVCWQIK